MDNITILEDINNTKDRINDINKIIFEDSYQDLNELKTLCTERNRLEYKYRELTWEDFIS